MAVLYLLWPHAMTENDSKSGDDDGVTRLTSDDSDAPTEITHDDAEPAAAKPTSLTGSEGDPSSVPANDAATELVDDAATTMATPAHPQTSRSANPLAIMQPGYMLKDRFRLEKKLGAGTMGAVFRAVDQRRVETQHHDPSVAIKLIAGDFSKDSRAFIALQRETDKSQTLAHPNIITVYDFDRDGDVFFMTMESLSGSTLDVYIKNGEDSRKQRLAYIEDMANAIAYAHKRNIVHSDVKPQNIFVTNERTLKVLDFGIARAVSVIDDDKSQNKKTDEIAGLTPTYASCEMFEKAEPHPSDDVYAIGLIAYEMLTGEHPFGRKKATQAKAEGLKPKKIKGLSSYQWHAISKALAFDRVNRWEDAEQFRRKFTGAGRVVKQLSAVLLLAIAGFGAYIMFFQPEAGPDIPFEQLPPATQQEFNAALNEGKQALRFGDINGALFYFDEAYTLHPRNERVMDEFDTLLGKILVSMPADAPADDKRRALAQIEELQKYESLEQNPRLANKKKELELQLK